MDKYSEVHPGKWQSKYSIEFKRRVCQEYLNGEIGIRALEKKYSLGNSRVTFWLKELGYEVKQAYYSPICTLHRPDPTMGKSTKDKYTQELEKKLQQALLEAEAYRKMIEIAEKELKIDIRKKSDTKQ